MQRSVYTTAGIMYPLYDDDAESVKAFQTMEVRQKNLLKEWRAYYKILM